ncbi:MAG: hypothetical protein ABI343_09195 [Burkholderiaceae bacterium]
MDTGGVATDGSAAGVLVGSAVAVIGVGATDADVVVVGATDVDDVAGGAFASSSVNRFCEASKISPHWPQRTHPSEMRN